MADLLIYSNISDIENNISDFYKTNGIKSNINNGINFNQSEGEKVKEKKKTKKNKELKNDKPKIEKTEKTEKIYDELFEKKILIPCFSSNANVSLYDFTLDYNKIYVKLADVKNNIGFGNIKFSSHNININGLNRKKLEIIKILKYFEDYVKLVFKKKILKDDTYIFKESLSYNNEYALNCYMGFNSKSGEITTPIFDENNSITEYSNIKKGDNLNYLIELDNIWIDHNKEIFGINWNIVQIYKNKNVFLNQCLLNSTAINTKPLLSQNATKKSTNLPPPPPLLLQNTNQKDNQNTKNILTFPVNLSELQNIKNKITGIKIDT